MKTNDKTTAAKKSAKQKVAAKKVAKKETRVSVDVLVNCYLFTGTTKFRVAKGAPGITMPERAAEEAQKRGEVKILG